MITPEQLAEWRALANAATPGPWTTATESTGAHGEGIGGTVVHGAYTRTGNPVVAICPHDDDAAFVAAARRAVPALLDEVERQRVEIETLHSLFVLLTRAEGDPKPALAPWPAVGFAGGVMECVSPQQWATAGFTAEQWAAIDFSLVSGDQALDHAVRVAANEAGLHFKGMHYEGIAPNIKHTACICTHATTPQTLALAALTTEDGREVSVLMGVCTGGYLHYAQVKA